MYEATTDSSLILQKINVINDTEVKWPRSHETNWINQLVVHIAVNSCV